MSSRFPYILRPWLAALVAVCGLGLVAPAAGAATSTGGGLNGWLSAGPTFPQRAVVLLPPAGHGLSTGAVAVTEDGAPVHGLTVTPLTQAGSGDFGLVVVLDQGLTMGGRSATAALGAVRSLAASRRAGQELGVVGVDGTPSVMSPLTTNSSLLDSVLAAPRGLGGKSDLDAGVQTAVQQLTQAGVALGAVVVVSDGADLKAGAATPTSASAAAAAARVPVFTVGLKDAASTAASLTSLSHAVPGRFVTASPSALPGVFKSIDATVTRGYVARWRSAVASNRTVDVNAQVRGIPGTITATYTVSGLHPASSASSSGHASAPAASGHLSTTPAFAPAVASAAAPPAPVATKSFWASPMAVPAVAGLAALLFGLALMCALYRPSQRAVRVRVGNFLPDHDEIVDDLGMGAGGESKSLLRMFERSKWWPNFVLNVDISGSTRTPAALVKRSAAMGVLAAIIIYFVSGSGLIAILAIFGWPFAMTWWIKRGARKQREKFKETLPNYLQDLSSAIRVGRSFIGALSVVTESADQPTKGELERAITDEALGRPIDEALEAVAVRMEAVDLSQVAMVAALNRRSGSNVAEALDRVAEGARERADLRREVKALTAQAKMSSSVLTALPGLMLLGVNLVSAKYAWPLLHTTMGLVLLGIGTAMVFAGWKVMAKITEIKI